jgi:putative Mn2+ efflux pump MntP
MRILGLYVFFGKALAKRDRKMSERDRSAGFQDAVESLVKAIESKDRIVLGNSVAFVGASVPEKLTVVGNGTTIMNSTLGLSKKNQDKCEPIVKISSRL